MPICCCSNNIMWSSWKQCMRTKSGPTHDFCSDQFRCPSVATITGLIVHTLLYNKLGLAQLRKNVLMLFSTTTNWSHTSLTFKSHRVFWSLQTVLSYVRKAAYSVGTVGTVRSDSEDVHEFCIEITELSIRMLLFPTEWRCGLDYRGGHWPGEKHR